MNDDIVQKADAFLLHMAYEMQDICDYCQRDKAEEIVPELVAEIKRLRSENDRADAEISKWQQTAIDRTAQIGWMTSCHCGRLPGELRWSYCDWENLISQSVRDGWGIWAAKELDLRISQG
ncbi:MAG: hypothetical protein WC124_02155 [Desulfoplanes sp.]